MNDINEESPVEDRQQEKLTDWKHEPTIRELMDNYTDARDAHAPQVSEIKVWLDYLNVTGVAKPKVVEGNSKIQPKLIRKQAEWRYANLSEPFLSSPDMFNVMPMTWEDAPAARQNQLILNNQFNTKIDKQSFIDSYVRAGVDEGTAVVKVAWDYKTRTDKVRKATYALIPDDSEQNIALLNDVAALQQESPSQYPEIDEAVRTAYEHSLKDGQPYRAVVNGSTEVDETVVTVNQPILQLCDFRNVVIDPSCGGDMKKAKFVVELFESSLAELKADGRYHNLDQINEQNLDILSEPDYASPDEGVRNFNFSDKARKRLVVYEYWGFVDIDGSGELQSIVASWVGQVMIRMELNPYPDGELPYVVVPYLPKKRNLYGESDGSLLIDNQRTVGATMRGMVDIMAKSANGQTGVQKGALDLTNRRRFDRGQNYEFNPGTDPRTAIHMHTFNEIPQSAQFMLQLQQSEADSMTGVKSFSSGISGQALGDTATGIRGALDAASKRELGILRRLANGVVQIGRKIIAMNAAFLEDKEVVRVTNEEFVEIRRDDLPGNFDLKLSISTAEEDNAQVADISFMLQTMGPNMDWGISKLLLAKVAELKKMPELAKSILVYQPQPDPVATEKAQLENMLIRAQIAAEQARAAHYASGANLQMAKSGTEEAKQRSLNSQADLADLDFVEQETGVHQERQLQQIDYQNAAKERLARINNQQKQMEEAMYPRTSQR